VAQIVFQIADDEIESVRQRMVAAGLLQPADDVSRPVPIRGERTRTTRRVAVQSFERNAAGEECLFVAGDQVARFAGNVARIDGQSVPVVAAVFERGQTRLIFPVGSGVAKPTAEIEVDE
jgi:hypothetical protein